MEFRLIQARSAQMLAAALLLMLMGGCAGTPRPAGVPERVLETLSGRELGARAAGIARSLAGSPYRFGGASPDGFDCSGLVVYSFARAGRQDLPHSVSGLDALSRPVRVDALEPGDLLFFPLAGVRKSHVGIYLGDRRFVHAPSSGKSVEVVPFDHVYWGARIRLAGRL
ncbi:MAG: C40 family peptidase [Deltaproteobacteria bacterium]|jgi:cell wall-associated NlpC family hydrolase|nr:C40 family peptidase [Deltaproteobacteria bacterium]MBW2499793.1 C40 family peptidase [Deltaproteobacteria bacterium]